MAEISKMLPGYNCGECGHRQCKDYAEEISIKGDISKCRYLELERFIDTKAEIQQFLSTHIVVLDKVEDLPLACQGCGEGMTGLKGDRKADFSLGPIPGEPSCREDLYPFARPTDIEPGDVLRYRALGCPVIHFAKVMRYIQGIATVHLAGSHQLLGEEFQYKDVGLVHGHGFRWISQQGPDSGCGRNRQVPAQSLPYAAGSFGSRSASRRQSVED